jgi:uncharacterized protein DUF4157
MGRWSELSKAGGHGVRNVADLIEDVVETVGDAITDIAETVGNAIEDGSYWLGGLAGRIPKVGGFFRGLLAWIGGMVARVATLAGSIVKAAFGIAGGTVGGILKIVFGGIFLNGGVVVDGLIDIGSNIAGGIIYVAGALLALVQRIFFLQGKDRALTKAERDLLHRIFQGSLGLYNVRVIEGRSGAFGINARPFTLGNTIYMKGTNAGTDPQTLVHECTHVWQYQNVGPRYTMDALGAQAVYHDAYDWQAEVTKGHTHWKELNKEAQAELVEDGWLKGTLTSGGTTTVGHGAFYDLKSGTHDTASFIYNGTDHTGLATDAEETLRGRTNARLSRALVH